MKVYVKCATPQEQNRHLYRNADKISYYSDHLVPSWEPKLLDFIDSDYFQNKVVPKLVAELNDTTDLWEEDFQNALVRRMAQTIASNKRGLGTASWHYVAVLNFKSVYNKLYEIARQYGHEYQ